MESTFNLSAFVFVVCWNLFCFQEVNQVFWGEGSPENSPGNSLDCAFLALQEDNQLVWKDMDCRWVLEHFSVRFVVVAVTKMPMVRRKLPPSANEAIFNQMDQLQPQPSYQPPQPRHLLQQHLLECPSVLKDGPRMRQAATGWFLIRLTGSRQTMGVPGSIQQHTLPHLGQNWRTTTLHTSTMIPTTATTSGWEEQILMRRVAGPGLMEPHSLSQSGTLAKVQMALQKTALL